MTNAIEELEAKVRRAKAQGKTVISVDYILSKLEEHQEMLIRPPESLVDGRNGLRLVIGD